MAYPTTTIGRTWHGFVVSHDLKSGRNWSMFIGRLALGFLFLWGGYQKILTELSGKMATAGFLSGPSVAGSPLAGFFNGLAGNWVVEVLVVYGELLIGVALILGVATRIGAVSGALQMVLFTVALWPIADAAGANPIVDYRVIYGLMFLMFVFLAPGRFLGIDGWLEKRPFVQRHPRLRAVLG
ncbi:MAG: DoxX family protein [Methanobacteriota archaeon]